MRDTVQVRQVAQGRFRSGFRLVGAVLLAVLANASAAHALSVALRWRPNSDPAITGYNVYVRPARTRYTGPTDAKLPLLQGNGVMSFVVNGLTNGQTYYFAVTAYDAHHLESALSNEVVLGTTDPCIVDRCISVTSCQVGLAPDGTACSAGSCRQGACTAIPPPVTSTCAAVADMTAVKLSIGKLNTPDADDSLSLQGEIVVPDPLSPPMDLVAHGLRLAIESAGGTTLSTMTIPPGAFDPSIGGGWDLSPHPVTWKWRSGTPAPGSANGIRKVVVKDISNKVGHRIPGHFNIKVSGRNGDYAVDPSDLPVRIRLLLQPDVSTSSACAVADFAGDPPDASCAFNTSGSSLRCKHR